MFFHLLIEEMSKVVYYNYIYPLIGTPSNDLCILLSFSVGRSINPIWGRNELFPFFFRAVALNFFFRGLEQMKPSFFLLGPPWLLILSSLFLASSWSPCLFETLGPCPWLGLDSPWLSTFHLAACSAPKSWTFWRRLEPLHEIEEPVLFRHIKNVQGEPRKRAFTYSRMGPVCFWLINMSDHNRAGTLHSAWNSSSK